MGNPNLVNPCSPKFPNFGAKSLPTWTKNTVTQAFAHVLSLLADKAQRSNGIRLLTELADVDEYEHLGDCCYDLAHSHYLNRDFEQSKRHACRVLRLQPEHSKAMYLLARIKRDETKTREDQISGALIATAAIGLAVVVAGFAGGRGGPRSR